MPTFISYVSYTQDAVKGMLNKPSDRSVGIKGLVEAIGGKLIAAYMTTGANDAVIISEAPDGSDVAAVELAIIASGAIAKVETVRAWTMPEYKEIMEKGSRVAAVFKPPGT